MTPDEQPTDKFVPRSVVCPAHGELVRLVTEVSANTKTVLERFSRIERKLDDLLTDLYKQEQLSVERNGAQNVDIGKLMSWFTIQWGAITAILGAIVYLIFR